jgi:hypothetical protein
MTVYNSQKLAQALGGHFRPGLEVLREALRDGYLLGLVVMDASLEPGVQAGLILNNILILNLTGTASASQAPETLEPPGAGLKAFEELTGLTPVLSWEDKPEQIINELLDNPELKLADFPVAYASKLSNVADIIKHLKHSRAALKWKEV